MKKEIDTYKLEMIFDAFKKCLIGFWYSSGIIASVTLWFFPVPPSRIQVFVFAAIFVVLTFTSIGIAKVEKAKNELCK